MVELYFSQVKGTDPGDPDNTSAVRPERSDLCSRLARSTSATRVEPLCGVPAGAGTRAVEVVTR
ncbi:hypothetical protein [Streptomyces sp. NPDC001537]